MSKHSLTDMVALNLRVPRGEAGYWSIVRDLDVGGAWTVRQVADRTNVSVSIVQKFIRKLQLGGYAEAVEKVSPTGNARNLPAATVYRLLKRPLDVPRLRPDGTALPVPAIERLWLAMKMLKAFDVDELVAQCAPVARDTVRNYCYQLAAAGVLRQSGTLRFSLVRNLGPAAPRIMSTKLVFDPNSKTVVGPSVAREVQP